MVRITTQPTRNRRGVLLLIVLSMLTLFLMLGSTYLVVAMRARKVARAFAHRANAAAMTGPNAARLVDEAFLCVARGTRDSSIAHLGSGDDLLGDKYGSDSLTGAIQSVAKFQGSDAFIEITETTLDPQFTIPKLPGRVLTFTLPGLSASVRIIAARNTQGSNKIVVPAGMTSSGRSISFDLIKAARDRAASNGKHFVINGREFDDSGTNESYDGFDDKNPLLARIDPPLTDTSAPAVTRATLSGTNALDSLDVDNDGDGVLDSQFLALGLPGFTTANGSRIEPRAAILVLDLDSRINLNVHDASGEADTMSSSEPPTSLYPEYLSISGNNVVYADPDASNKLHLRSLPLGIAGSPARASIRKAFSFAEPAASDVKGSVLDASRAAGGVMAASLPADARTNRPSPEVGEVEGRYGKSTWDRDNLAVANLPRPGQIAFNDPITSERDRWTTAITDDPDDAQNKIASDYFTDPIRYGAPPDLKGRMRIWADPLTGQPVYFKPYWDELGRSASNATLTDNELVDDPYELNLTRTGSQLATLSNPGTGGRKVDNPFSAADLEALLRFYDADTLRLSRRLPALLSEVASDARLRVTTESWDTTAIVGSAWRDAIESKFSAILRSGTAANATFAPETIAGNKLDISRPFHITDYSEPNDAIGTARRQQFARHIYSLLIGISDANGASLDAHQKENLAQFAVNVVDFRDADSVMTKFDYDPSFGPGSSTWSPSKTVWGCERPELIITETLAWHDRRTDDLEVGNKMVATPPTPAIPAASADDDFDQQHRPQGAFFVELTVPPASAAMRSEPSGAVADVLDPVESADPLRGELLPRELVATEDTNNNGQLDGGEDSNGNNKIDDSPSRMLRSTTIQLDKVVADPVANNRSPVWRLVTVTGTAAFGTDPTSGATTNTSECILDPGREGGPPVERAFYFAEPPPPLKASPVGDPAASASAPSNGVFWLGSAVTGPLSEHTVVGTNATFAPGGTGPVAPEVLAFTDGQDRPATLTEPTTKHATNDAYQVLAEQAFSNFSFTGTSKQWGSPLDAPIDATAQADFGNAADITSGPFLDSNGNPILMQNGTHENFAVVHLQRLANPTKPWDPAANPYLTVDSMPVDLTVVNYSNGGDGPCYDEPGISGGAPLTYLQQQKNFGRILSTTPESVERGGKTSVNTDDENNLWNSRVDPDRTNLRDGLAMHSADVEPRASNGGYTPPDDTSPVVLTAVTPLVPAQTLGNPPDRAPSNAALPWFFFSNRPYESGIEISLVPISSPFHLLKQYSLDTGLTPIFCHLPGFWESAPPSEPWDAITGRAASNSFSILDFVHVPSRFTGLAASVAPTASVQTGVALSNLGFDQLQYGQISHFREPGRINLNTVTSGTTASGAATGPWRAIFGPVDFAGDNDVASSSTGLDPSPQWTVAMLATPKKSIVELATDDSIPIGRNDWTEAENTHRDTDRNAFFRYSRILQVADRITTRSNVFAIWVTIGFFEVDSAGDVVGEVMPATRLRGFYLFDRSIPVGYERGNNHNVTDAVLLRRIIQ